MEERMVCWWVSVNSSGKWDNSESKTKKEDTVDGQVLAGPLADGFAPFGSKFQARTPYTNVNPATDEHTPGLSPSWAVCSVLWVPVSLSQTSRSSLADPGQIPTCSCCESGSPSAAVHCSNIRKDKTITSEQNRIKVRRVFAHFCPHTFNQNTSKINTFTQSHIP